MRKTINQYLSLNKNIINLLIAGFFVNIIGVSLFLILNIFLSKKGFNDVQIANYISYRFLAITFFALPFGLFIKKRKLKPFFYIGGIGVPATTGLLIFSINNIELHSLIPYIFILLNNYCRETLSKADLKSMKRVHNVFTFPFNCYFLALVASIIRRIFTSHPIPLLKPVC